MVSWVGVCAIIHRINTANNQPISDVSVLTLTPREVLALIPYLAPPDTGGSGTPQTCITTKLHQADSLFYTTVADQLYHSSAGHASEDTVKRLMHISKDDRVTPVHGKL